MITTYNIFPREVPSNEWTIEPSGTALEAISTAANKNKVETSTTTEVSSESPLLKSGTIKQKVTAKFAAAAAKKALEEGGICIGAKVHVFGKSAVTTVNVKVICSLGVSGAELAWSSTTVSEWRFATISVPALITAENIETILVELEHMKSNAMRLFEFYMSLEIEEAAGGGAMTMLV